MAATAFSSMKVSQLRALCTSMGVNTTNMLEKHEFVQALESKATATATTTTAGDEEGKTPVDFHEMKISTLRNLCTSMGVKTTGMVEKRDFVEALHRKTGTTAREVSRPSGTREPEPRSDCETTNHDLRAEDESSEDNHQRDSDMRQNSNEGMKSSSHGASLKSPLDSASKHPSLSNPESDSQSHPCLNSESLHGSNQPKKSGSSPSLTSQAFPRPKPNAQACPRSTSLSPKPKRRLVGKKPASPTSDFQRYPRCTSESPNGSNPAKRSGSSPTLSSQAYPCSNPITQACPLPLSLSPKPKRHSAGRNPSSPTADSQSHPCCNGEGPNDSNPPKRSGSSPTLRSQVYPRSSPTAQARPRPNSLSPKPKRRVAARNPSSPTSDSRSHPFSKSSADPKDRPNTTPRSPSTGSVSPAKLSTIEKIRRQQQKREKEIQQEQLLRAKHMKRRGQEMMDEPVYHDSAGMYDNSTLNESRRFQSRRTAISDNETLNESGRLQSRRTAISTNNAQ